MFEGYIMPIITAVVILAGLGFAFSKSSTRSLSQKRASLPNTLTVTHAPRQGEESSVKTIESNENARLIAKLLKQVRQICLGDEAKVQRLTGFERKRNLNAGLAELIQDALNRLRDDIR